MAPQPQRVAAPAHYTPAGYERARSEGVVVQSPTSFVGSARRIWKLTLLGPQPWAKLGTIPLAIVLTLAAWCFCAAWYFFFGVLLVPWRMLRRGQRRRKQEKMRHNEILNEVRRSR
jgi:hypothetical protein